MIFSRAFWWRSLEPRIKSISQASKVYLNGLRSYSHSTFRMSNKHKIAICQFTCKADKDENFEVAKKLLVDAKAAGAKVDLNSLFSLLA